VPSGTQRYTGALKEVFLEAQNRPPHSAHCFLPPRLLHQTGAAVLNR